MTTADNTRSSIKDFEDDGVAKNLEDDGVAKNLEDDGVAKNLEDDEKSPVIPAGV